MPSSNGIYSDLASFTFHSRSLHHDIIPKFNAASLQWRCVLLGNVHHMERQSDRVYAVFFIRRVGRIFKKFAHISFITA